VRLVTALATPTEPLNVVLPAPSAGSVVVAVVEVATVADDGNPCGIGVVLTDPELQAATMAAASARVATRSSGDVGRRTVGPFTACRAVP
jgi:hypothetical protein